MNPYKNVDDNSYNVSHKLSYEDIASKLLKDNYFLTALELHTELVECGRELPQLREFFSNPGNFEQHVNRASDLGSMHRTPSIATLDSLDTTRFSEDGGGDRGGSSGGDVAVLEFELRKAKETINALRANLTQFADGESALDNNSSNKYSLDSERALKPHEKRALNFLLNEYLLLQDYKLTSITFSDENPDQDFEDWDDVGLNIPRPSGLVSLFRGTSSIIHCTKSDAATEMQLDIIQDSIASQTEEECLIVCQNCTENDTDWNHEILVQAEEIELLKHKINELETEKLNFQKLYDAAIVSLNSLATPTSECKAIELNLSHEKLLMIQEKSVIDMIETKPITCTALENHYGSENSTHSVTPEQFEIIDNDKNNSTKIEGSIASIGPSFTAEHSAPESLRRGSVTTLDETLSLNDGGEWTRVQYEYNESTKEMWIDSGIPSSLKMAILNWCSQSLHQNEPLDNDLLQELVNSDKPVTLDGLVTLVADTLPRILPHTLVARRCDSAALLAAVVTLLESTDVRRARILQSLLTLVKRPDKQMTRSICEAASLVVKWGGSGEVLSSVAELLLSKTPERRYLASQICLTIAPFVPIELCSSLLLSIVAMMCDSGDSEIRNLGLKAACLTSPVAEHKYGQLEALMFGFLRDSVDKNVSDALNVFLPVLARSALVAGKFSTDLCASILKNLIKSSKHNDWKDVILYLEVFNLLALAKVAYVSNVQVVKKFKLNHCDKQEKLENISLEKENYYLSDVQCYVVDSSDGKEMVDCMNNMLKENPELRWPELDWFIDLLRQTLDAVTQCKIFANATIYNLLLSLFNRYVKHFGPQFSASVLKTLLLDIILELEEKIEKLDSVVIEKTVIVGVYLATVLAEVGDNKQRMELMQKWIVYSSLRDFPAKLFSIPLKWVNQHKTEDLESYLRFLKESSESNNTNSSTSKIKVYISSLLTDLTCTTDVQDKCIELYILPIVDRLLNDGDITVRESAFTLWGAVTRSCFARSLQCEPQCWRTIKEIIDDSRHLSSKELSRLSESLALLISPTDNTKHISEKAVTLLCSLSDRAPFAAEWLSAYTAGLQLAFYHSTQQALLTITLRKVDVAVQSNPSLFQFRQSMNALLQEYALSTLTKPSTEKSSSSSNQEDNTRQGNKVQTAQDVGRRVSQMFQQSKSNMNLQNIFRKKS